MADGKDKQARVTDLPLRFRDGTGGQIASENFAYAGILDKRQLNAKANEHTND